MAIYTINSRVIFNDQIGSLSLSEGREDPTILAAPASRLLTLLIKNNNKVLTRDEILTEVWENHGLVASSNNLYHYISVIRRSLASLGEDNIIVTLPKVGFSMKALSVVTEGEEDKNVLPYVEEILDEQELYNLKLTESKPYNQKKSFNLAGYNKRIGVVAGILILTAIIVAIYSNYFNSNQVYFNYPPLDKIKKCNIHPLKKTSPVQDNLTINEMKSKLAKYQLDCNRDANIYYSNERGYKLIYYCTLLSGTIPNPQDCFNIIVDDEVSL